MSTTALSLLCNYCDLLRWPLNLDFFAMLIFHIIPILIFLGNEFEHAVIVHRHGFATDHVVVELVGLLVIFHFLQDTERPRKNLSQLIRSANE